MGVTRPHSPPSPRDVLLASLLALDEAPEALSGEPPPDPTTIEQLALALESLITSWQEHFGGGTEVPAFAYGVPDWLVSSEGPLQQVADGLRSPSSELPPAWRSLRERLWGDGPGAKELGERETDALEELRIHLADIGHGRASDGFRRELFARPGLAAATAGAGAVDSPPFLELAASAEPLIAATDATKRDLGWRRIRVDVPVTVRGAGHGAMIGIEAWFPEFDRPPQGEPRLRCEPSPVENAGPAAAAEDDRLCMSDSFQQGVAAGHRAACELLRELGADLAARRVARMGYRLVGLRPPMRVEDESAALPVALHVLAVAADLPRPRCVATGRIDGESGRLAQLNHEKVDEKLRAVQREGLVDRLLVHTKAKGPADNPAICPVRQNLLSAAAGEAWGDAWHEWHRALGAERLSELGFECGWSPDSLDAPAVLLDGEEVDVPFGEDDVAPKLLGSFREGARVGDRVKAVLGGWSGSGKTWMARWIAEELISRPEGHEDRIWQVAWIAPAPEAMEEALENRGELLVEAVGLLLRGMPAGERLVIVEGLEATEERTNLGAPLDAIAEEHNAHVLALARYYRPGGPEFRTEGVLVRPATLGPQVVAFAERLLEAYPQLEPARKLIPAAARASGGSLEVLIRFLQEFGTEMGATDSVSLQRVIADRARAATGPGQAEALKRLAARSCLRLPTDAAELPELDPETLRRVWARGRPMGQGRVGWYLPSWFVARELISAGSGAGPGQHLAGRFEAELVVVLADLLQEAVGRDDRGVALLLNGARRYSDLIFRRLVEIALPTLEKWTDRAGPRSLAFFLNRCARMLTPRRRTDLVDKLTRRVAGGMEALHASELAYSLKQIHRHDHLLQQGSDDQRRLLAALEDALRRGLPAVIAGDRHAGPHTRILLLRRIRAMGLPSGDAIVLENYEALLAGMRTNNPLHYRVLGEGIAHLSKIAPDFRLHFGDGGLQRVEPIEPRRGGGGGEAVDESGSAIAHGGVNALLTWLPDVLAMLEKPPRDRKAGVYLGWLGIKATLEPSEARKDWRLLVGEVEEPLLQSLPKADAAEIARSMSALADRQRPLAIFLLRNPALVEPLITSLSNSSPGEAAELLGTIAGIRPRLAWSLLYDGRRIRSELHEVMAARIAAWEDAKGAGNLLARTAAIDEIYGSTTSGFARALAESIGADFALRTLRHDPRTSVIYHLVAGLVAAGADYLPALRSLIAARIVENIRSDSRSWAPRLALRLASDEALGRAPGAAEDFLEQLSAELRVRDGRQSPLFERMVGADEPQALAAFHRLADALDYPKKALATAFAEDFKGDWIKVALGRDAMKTAEACRAVTGTLARAEVARPGRELVEALEREEWSWLQRIEGANARQLAQTIDVLRRFDWATAREVVEKLGAPVDVGGDQTGVTVLADRVWQSSAEGSLRLLGTVEETVPGAGRRMVAEFKRRSPGGWAHRLNELRFVANPVDWCGNFRVLAILDALPPEAADRAPLWDRWADGFEQFRSPRAADAFLRTFACWPDKLQRAREVAERLDLAAIRDRIEEGAIGDLERAPALIGSLYAIGMRTEAGEMAAGLADSDVPDRLTPRALSQLLRVLRVVDRGLATPLLPQAERTLERAIARRLVLQPAGHWLEIGWLAYEIGRLGSRPRVPDGDPPPTLPIGHDPATLWGAFWLDGADWAEEAARGAVGRISQTADAIRPGHLCLALGAVAGTPDAEGMLASDRSWELALRAQPASLGVLIEGALRDDLIGDFLRSHESELSEARDRLSRPENRGAFACVRALELIDALEASPVAS